MKNFSDFINEAEDKTPKTGEVKGSLATVLSNLVAFKASFKGKDVDGEKIAKAEKALRNAATFLHDIKEDEELDEAAVKFKVNPAEPLLRKARAELVKFKKAGGVDQRDAKKIDKAIKTLGEVIGDIIGLF